MAAHAEHCMVYNCGHSTKRGIEINPTNRMLKSGLADASRPRRPPSNPSTSI